MIKGQTKLYINRDILLRIQRVLKHKHKYEQSLATAGSKTSSSRALHIRNEPSYST